MKSIKLPFPGFCHSHLDYALDSEFEQAVENEIERQQEDWPEPLHITDHGLSSLLFDSIRWSLCHNAMARDWCAAANSFLGDLFTEKRMVREYPWHKAKTSAWSVGLKFEEMTSPREYNFETDRLFATVPDAFVRKLWRLSKVDDHARLQAMIAEHFTSRDGFASFYPNTLAAWPSDPMTWDHNELGTLLLAMIDLETFNESCADHCLEGDGYLDKGWQSGWDTAARADLFRQWLEDDKPAALAWAGNNAESFLSLEVVLIEDDVPYRCALTPDLFQGAAS